MRGDRRSRISVKKSRGRRRNRLIRMNGIDLDVAVPCVGVLVYALAHLFDDPRSIPDSELPRHFDMQACVYDIGTDEFGA